MSLRIDATGTVRVGKSPTSEYTVRWQNATTGEVRTEVKTEALKTLKNYIFSMGMNYNFQGHGTILRAEIWRTYKNQSKRVHEYGGGIK